MKIEWPGAFESAEEHMKDVTVFNDHGIRYCADITNPDAYVHMENIPEEMENRC